MHKIFTIAALATAAAFSTHAAAQITFYEKESFAGRSFTTQQRIGNFERFGFNDRASSVVVARDRWEVCEDARFGGRCMVLRAGRYPSLAAMGLNDRVSSVRPVDANVRVEDNRYAPIPGAPQITFYQREGFAGQTFTTQQQVGNFENFGFNDRASSAVVVGNRWEVCEDVRFGGRCMVLRPGRYPSLAAMGLNDRVSSVRAVNVNTRLEDNRYAPIPGAPQVTFYEREGFAGQTFTTQQQVGNFENFGFNDRASSVVVVGERWEVCDDVRFLGRCTVLRPGRYPSLAAMGLNDRVSSVRMVAGNGRIADNRYAPAIVVAPAAAAQITFYENEGFGGRTFAANGEIGNFAQHDFNDRASSVVVLSERWEICEDALFRGRCVVLRPGRYPALSAMGLNDRISSVRMVHANTRIEDERYAPAPVAGGDFRRRNNERLYEANVTAVRAVVAAAEQRCWVEREQVGAERRTANIPAAVAGAIIGGILGHQVGNGRGNDIATVGGAIGGAVVGANIGGGPKTQDVKRCETAPSQARPEYWDVTYNFRGQDYRVQMTTPPGPTVTVNEQGEPRA